MAPPDLLVVSVDSTSGWQASARELTDAFRRAGASVALVGTGPVAPVRTFALTDFVQARAARRAGQRAVAERDPVAVVYCSITAALLWPRPGAIWVDSIAAENRPGRHGIWQRPLERRRLRQAPLVLKMSEQSLAPLGPHQPEAVIVPVPVEASGPTDPAQPRDVDVLAYAGNPEKKRLDFILEAWEHARRDRETLVVAGTDPLPPRDGVHYAGRLPPDRYRELLRRARVFVAAPRREDHGIAQLEALADGCILVTTAAPGPYPARDLARVLDPRLVGEDLAGGLRRALDEPRPRYAERAGVLLAPFSRAAIDRTIAERVLPALLAAGQRA